jgi:ADP-ribosylglycohydrolase
MSLASNIRNTLALAAIGDSMGAATETLTFDQIRETFGGPLTELVAPPATAYATGNKPGEVTDDFSQIYYTCEEVIANDGVLTRDVAANALFRWKANPKFDRFLGPTTTAALEMYKNGETEYKAPGNSLVVDYAAKATNGAAMKIATAGILHPGDLEGATEAAITIASVTHDNDLALSGAIAVACATAESLSEHATVDSVLAAGYYGAVHGRAVAGARSRKVAGAGVSSRIELAHQIVSGPGTKEERLRRLSEVVGSGIHISEAVASAFGCIMLNKDDVLQAVIDAVNIGYDTDTVACITGSMVGGLVRDEDPRVEGYVRTIEAASDIDLAAMAEKLAGYSQD